MVERFCHVDKISVEDEYLKISNEISSLKDERDELEKKLNVLSSEEDIIEFKFEIIKIDEKISVLENKLQISNKKMEEEKQKILEEERRLRKQELYYKKIYITLTENMSLFNRVFNIASLYNDESIEYLLNNYTEQQLFRVIDLFNFLDSSIFDNFIHEFHTSNIPINILLNKYEKKCISIENLRISIKNKIKKVEDKWDLKFNGFIRKYYFCAEFIKDFSQEIDFESFLLENFPEYVSIGIIYSYADDIDSKIGEMYSHSDRVKYCEELTIYSDYSDIVRYCEKHWEELSEFDKLNSIDEDQFFDIYLSDLENEISEIVEGDFDYGVDVKLPPKRTPIIMQTQEHKYKKDREEVYEKKVQRYDELIAKKRYEKKYKSYNRDCINNLNEDSSIEDIANCYCKYEGFDNWEYDEKNKMIIFKLFKPGGKKYSKLRKLEVKKLESWPKTVKK